MSANKNANYSFHYSTCTHSVSSWVLCEFFYDFFWVLVRQCPVQGRKPEYPIDRKPKKPKVRMKTRNFLYIFCTTGGKILFMVRTWLRLFHIRPFVLSGLSNSAFKYSAFCLWPNWPQTVNLTPYPIWNVASCALQPKMGLFIPLTVRYRNVTLYHRYILGI